MGGCGYCTSEHHDHGTIFKEKKKKIGMNSYKSSNYIG